MNKNQKEVLQAELDAEKKTIKELKQVYERAKQDCLERIKALEARTDVENLQSIVYQKQYQEALKKQLDSILDMMNAEQFEKISDYLSKCYENGFVGTMYDLQGQGIPLIFPIDQTQITQAVQIDSKISEGLYNRLGVDTKKLKNSIRANVSRGIAASQSWFQVAKSVENRMNIGLNRSLRIARTEGHRIQNESAYHAQLRAKEKGADIVKQWDATLDRRTRPSHAALNGMIVEADEKFRSPETGNEALYPGEFGVASEDINCRCTILQRARWALDAVELETIKERAEYFGLDKSQNFEDYKKKYLKLPEKADKIKTNSLKKPVESSDEHYNKCIECFKGANVQYIPVDNRSVVLSEEDIIKELAGADKTSGSCASVAMAYIGQKQGYNVHDFRGGSSMETFGSWDNLKELVQMEGMKIIRASGTSSLTVGTRLLEQVEVGKEYYLVAGSHASIVRKTTDHVLQYLELQGDFDSQSAYNKAGWHDFTNPYNLPVRTTVKETLKWRFGCNTQSNPWHEKLDFMIDLDKSKLDTDKIRSILGYINTSAGSEMKGAGGTIK